MRIKSLLSLIVFSSLSVFARAEEVSLALDWSGGTVGKPPTAETFPSVRFSSKGGNPEQFLVVGAEGSPSNPFSHLEKAIVLQRGEQDSTPVIVFSLPGKVGYGKGSFTFEFFLPPGGAKGEGFRFSLRAVEQGSRPSSAGIFRVTASGFTFQETTEAPVLKARSKLSIGATNTIRIDWDFESKSGYDVFLNDKPVTIASEGAEPTFFPVSASEVKGGIRELLIYPRANVTLFIGKVTATAK